MCDYIVWTGLQLLHTPDFTGLLSHVHPSDLLPFRAHLGRLHPDGMVVVSHSYELLIRPLMESVLLSRWAYIVTCCNTVKQ